MAAILQKTFILQCIFINEHYLISLYFIDKCIGKYERLKIPFDLPTLGLVKHL